MHVVSWLCCPSLSCLEAGEEGVLSIEHSKSERESLDTNIEASEGKTSPS
jgi:hypothetical protein